MLGSKLRSKSLFSYARDGHQAHSRGLQTHYKDSLLKGGMTIPNIRSLDPGTYNFDTVDGSEILHHPGM